MSGIEPLYEDSGTGRLGIGEDGKAFRAHDGPSYSGASLTGPEPSFGRGSMQGSSPKGIGGSLVGRPEGDGDAHVSSQQVHGHQGGNVGAQALTPDQLMALAKQMEQDLMESVRQSEGSTAVDPALIRTGGHDAYGGTITEDAPDWLVKYMEGQQPMGEFQMGGAGQQVDKVKAKQYLSQREMLRHLKAQK